MQGRKVACVTAVKKSLIILAVAVTGAWMLYARGHAPAAWTGRPAPEPPRQWTAQSPAPWTRDDFTFRSLALFQARAIVLSRCNYSGGHDSELAPTDFALGWGAMSEAAVINRVKVSQDMRWYMLRWRGDVPLDGTEIMRSSANMHLIPASEEVARELRTVRRHELIEISGHLVEARHVDGWTWRSSTSREDTGGGACEVVWVERIQRRPPHSP